MDIRDRISERFAELTADLENASAVAADGQNMRANLSDIRQAHVCVGSYLDKLDRAHLDLAALLIEAEDAPSRN